MIASESFEGSQRPVASRRAVGRRDAVKRALLECEIGVEVNVRGSFLPVT